MYRIRAIDAKDVDILAVIHQKCFIAAYDPPWKTRTFQEYLASQSVVAFKAEYQDASIVLGFVFALISVDFGDILTLAVDPQYQNQQVATSLLNHLRASYSLDFFIEVSVLNQNALSFYHKYGFQVIQTRNGYYRAAGMNEKAIDAFVMKIDKV